MSLRSGLPRVAPLDLGPAAALGEIFDGLGFGLVTDLDTVLDRGGAGKPGQTGSSTLALDDVGMAFDGGYASLDVNREFVFGDLGPGEAVADGLLKVGVREEFPRTRPRGRRGFRPGAGGGRHAWQGQRHGQGEE